jgi:hypothetical protein
MSTNNNRYNNEIRPIWLSKVHETKQIQTLSGAKLERMVSNDLSRCTAVSLANRSIKRIDDLKCFGKQLRRLDLSGNELSRLQGFVSLSQLDNADGTGTGAGGAEDRKKTAARDHDAGSIGLSLLNISSNAFKGDSGLEDLRYLTELRTLNLSRNTSIHVIRSHIIKPLAKLQALIANDCGFESAAFVRFLPHLNTLILSDNQLTALPMNEYGRFSELKKLSLSRNKLSAIPNLSTCSSLTELRMNQNEIVSIPSDFLTYHEKNLKLLDLSNNKLADWESVNQLSCLMGLTNLALHGNPLCSSPAIDASKCLREDISADQILDPIERLYRHNVLLTFQRQVGKQAKLFVQLIVLDNKRVKTKWTQGGAHHAHADADHVDHPQEEDIENDSRAAIINPRELEDQNPVKSEKSKKNKRREDKLDAVDYKLSAESMQVGEEQAQGHSQVTRDDSLSLEEEPVTKKKPKHYHIDDDKLKSVLLGKKQQIDEYGLQGWN